MIRISDFYSLVKIFFLIFFPSNFRLNNNLNYLSQRLLKYCLEFMSKKLMIVFFIPMKERIDFKAKGLSKELLLRLLGM